MALTQGSALPNITTNQTQSTTAPAWYTDYLSSLASQGNAATQGAQYVGATPMQEQAFGQAQQNVGNYQPALSGAMNLANNVGNSNVADMAGQFMTPYTQNVIDSLQTLGQRNIEQYLAPGATAAAVGSGQFGSKRGAEVLGQAMNQGLQNLTAAQNQALQTGYGQALTAAQNQQANQLAASQQLGSLANQTQSQGLTDVNALATLGGQQQTIAQNQQLFPMQQLTSNSALLRGYSVPTAVQSSYTGPIPGAYSASPLSQIAGIGSLLGALNTAGANGTSPASNIMGGLSGLGGFLGNLFSSPGATYDPGLIDSGQLNDVVGASSDPAQNYSDWLTGSGGWGNYGE